MRDLMYSEEEMELAEDTAESILCIKCSIDKDEKDCSSCEKFIGLRDLHLKRSRWIKSHWK